MNDRVVCVMSVGAGKYRKQYELVRDNLMAYAKKCHADFRFIDDYIDKDKKRDIYSQKLLIPDYLREYEQVLFLDLDIIISPDCPDIFALMPENIGLMAEVNPPLVRAFPQNLCRQRAHFKRDGGGLFYVARVCGGGWSGRQYQRWRVIVPSAPCRRSVPGLLHVDEEPGREHGV